MSRKKCKYVNKLLDGLRVIYYYLSMLIKNKISKVNIFADNKIITYEVGVNCDKINLGYNGNNNYDICIANIPENKPIGCIVILATYYDVWAIWN